MCPWVGPHAPSFGRQLWGAAQPCGVSFTTRGIAPACLRTTSPGVNQVLVRWVPIGRGLISHTGSPTPNFCAVELGGDF